MNAPKPEVTRETAEALVTVMQEYLSTGNFPSGYELLLFDNIDAIYDAILDYAGEFIIRQAVDTHGDNAVALLPRIPVTPEDAEWLQKFLDGSFDEC